MRETAQKLFSTSLIYGLYEKESSSLECISNKKSGSKNLTDKGTIRRKDLIVAYQESSEALCLEIFMKLEAQWIVGFVDGEGCFHIAINRNDTMTTGYQVLPEFTVVQHELDIKVLHALKKYFGCGVVRVSRKDKHSTRMAYRVRSIKHLLDIISPFFMQHQLKTQKNVEFRKFRKVLLMMDKGQHLTAQGLEKIQEIAGQMNRKKQVNI